MTVSTSTLNNLFKDMPEIPDVGKPPNKLNYKERKRRLADKLWTGSDGTVYLLSNMTDSHIFNTLKMLILREDKELHINKWIEIFIKELEQRKTSEAKKYLVKITLIK